MRRRYIVPATAFLLSVANAFSLSNFQAINSPLIPLSCSQQYNAEIPVCDQQDFNVKCSDSCKRALEQVEVDVTAACVGVILNSKSLLGIVKSGGIIPALCSNPGSPASATSSTSRASTTAPAQTTSKQQASTTRATSSLRQTTSQTDTPSDSNTSTTPSPSSTADVQQSSTSARTSVAETVRSSSTRAAEAAESTSDSGGGSPFDIVSAAGRSESSSILSMLVLGGWTLALLVR